MAACPFLTGVWTFRCLARSSFVIPSITEETRYCLGKHPERCPHYHDVRTDTGGLGSAKAKDQVAARPNRGSKAY
ncbi:MAG: hypothetical protein WAW06_03075 [bacterium]